MIAGVPVRVAQRMADCDRCAVAGAGPLQGAGVPRCGAVPRCGEHGVQCGVGGGSTGRDRGNRFQQNMAELVQHAVPALATGGTRQPRVVRAVAAHRGAI